MKITDPKVIGSIVVLTVLLATGAYFYYGDVQRIWEVCLSENLELEYCVYSVERDGKGITQVELLTHNITTDDSNDFVRWRLDKDRLTVYNGRFIGAKAHWKVDYFKTYGEDKWVNLKRKVRKIELELEEFETYVILRKRTEYYAVASLSGTGGWLVEEIMVGQNWHKYSVRWEPHENMMNRIHHLTWIVDSFGLGEEQPRRLEGEYVLELARNTVVSWLDSAVDANFGALTEDSLELQFNDSKGVFELHSPSIGIGKAANDFYTKLYSSDQCLAECTAEFKICNPTTGVITTSSKEEFDMRFVKKNELSSDLESWHIEVLGSESYQSPIYAERETCGESSPRPHSTSTAYRCWIEGYIASYETLQRPIWQPAQLNELLLEPQECKTVRLTGIRQAKLGENSIDWIATIGGFEIKEDDWWNGNWGYKKAITLKTSDANISANITDDHVILFDQNFEHTDFWANVAADGSDVRFTSNDEVTEFKYYLQDFNTDNDNMHAWVLVTDTFPSASDLDVHMYYGNAGASDGQDAANTLTDFEVVWHADDFSGTTVADKLGDYDGNTHPDIWDDVNKHFGDSSLGLDGTYFANQATLLDTVPTNLAFSYWIRPNIPLTTDTKYMLYKVNDATGGALDLISVYHSNAKKIVISIYLDNVQTLLTGVTNTWSARWHHVMITWDTTGGLVLYVDGKIENANVGYTTLMDNGTAKDFIFAHSDGTDIADLQLDEFKMHKTRLTVDEVHLLYDSESRLLQEYGAQEEIDAAAPTVFIFVPASKSWESGTVNIDINVWDAQVIKGAWIDSNVANDCFADQNIVYGDNNLTWDSTDTDCSAMFDINIVAYAFDFNALNPMGSDDREFHIDNVDPITVSVSDPAWQSSDVNQQFKCTDSGGGCKYLFYNYDDANYQTSWSDPGAGQAYSDQNIGIVITADGNTAVFFWSGDYADNNESEKFVSVIIDKVNPEVIISKPNDGNQFYDSSTITFDVNDATSGVNTTTIQIDINGSTSSDMVFVTDCVAYDLNYRCSYEETAFDTNGADYNITIFVNDISGKFGEATSEFKWAVYPSVLWGNVNDYYVSDDSGIDLYLSSLVDQNVTPFGQNDLNGIFNVTNDTADGATDVNTFLDLNQSLPNDSNLTVCNQNRRVTNDVSKCWDVNASSEAFIIKKLAYDANQMLWWFFDLNLVGEMGMELVIDYAYRVEIYA